MAYSTSLATLRKIEPRLTSLARGVGTSWRTDNASEAQKFAYKVREALYIAMNNSAQFPALARAHSLFTIQVNGNIVQAVANGGVPVEQRMETTLSPANYTPSGPVDTELTCVGPSSVAEIVQYWLDAQPTNATISVVEAVLTNGELKELSQWAAGLFPPWEMVHEAGQSNLIIRPARSRSVSNPGMPLRTASPSDSSTLYEK